MARWERDQWVLVVVSLIVSVAAWLTVPALPLLFQALAGDGGGALLWTGAAFSVGSLAAALVTPWWAAVGNHYGHRGMAYRALASLVVLTFALAFVHDLAVAMVIRVLLGLLAGYGPTAMALAANGAPRERSAGAVATIQFTQILGAVVGPFLGGLLTSIAGERAPFLVAGLGFTVAGVLFHLLFAGGGRPAPATRARQGSMLALVGQRPVQALLVAAFAAQFVEGAVPPLLPAFLAELGTPDEAVASLAGLILALSAAGGAVATLGIGRFSSRRADTWEPSLLLGSLMAGAVLVAPLLLVSQAWQLALLRAALGLVSAGSLALIYGIGARLAPAAQRGAMVQLLVSAALLGGSLSPLLAGALGGLSLRAIFALGIVIYLAGTLTLWRAGLVTPAAPASLPRPAGRWRSGLALLPARVTARTRLRSR